MNDPRSAVVLVTGASGFVGRHVVLKLAAEGWRVRAAARNVAAIPRGDGADPVSMDDLADRPDWRRLVTGVTHIVHLAGIAHHPPGLRSDTLYRVNAEAAGELAQAASRAGVSRFVFVSSVRAQCGPACPAVLREDMPPCPIDDYGRSKLAGEAEISKRMRDTVILRPALIYGPGAKGNFATLRRAAELPIPLPFKHLKARRSLLSLGNLADAVSFCLKAPNVAGQCFLVADPEPHPLGDIVSIMRAARGRSPGLIGVSPRLLEAAMRLTGQGQLVERLLGGGEVSIAKLIGAGWRPAERTEDALRAMILRQKGPGR